MNKELGEIRPGDMCYGCHFSIRITDSGHLACEEERMQTNEDVSNLSLKKLVEELKKRYPGQKRGPSFIAFSVVIWNPNIDSEETANMKKLYCLFIISSAATFDC